MIRALKSETGNFKYYIYSHIGLPQFLGIAMKKTTGRQGASLVMNKGQALIFGRSFAGKQADLYLNKYGTFQSNVS